jgi:penicillin-binding protein activator
MTTANRGCADRRRMRFRPELVLCLAGILGIFGCAGTKVTRLSADTTVDLSGHWNDTDSREVSEAMIQEALARPWIQEWTTSSNGRKPTVVVGIVRNNTTEHIPVGTFVADIERAMINSGSVKVVATTSERADTRSERADQWQNATEESAKKMGRELGADFLLGGTIESITDREGHDKIVFYQCDLNLINIETNLKVWMGQKKIKKLVSQSRLSP